MTCFLRFFSNFRRFGSKQPQRIQPRHDISPHKSAHAGRNVDRHIEKCPAVRHMQAFRLLLHSLEKACRRYVLKPLFHRHEGRPPQRRYVQSEQQMFHRRISGDTHTENLSCVPILIHMRRPVQQSSLVRFF